MQTRSQTVADGLRQAILNGDYLPGDRLEEVPIAEAMSVSRTPVRAALAALEKEGLLSYVPKRGYEVRRFGVADIADMYKVRAVLEAHAAAECALAGLAEADLADLQECLDTGDTILSRGALDSGDLPAYREMNHRFHEKILLGCGSQATGHFVRQTRQIPLLSDRIILWHDYRLIDRSHDDHRRVADAIRERNPLRAHAVMHEHVAFMGLVVCRYLEENAERGAVLQEAES